ncbi:MAG: hypothetical protein ACYCTW_11365 [Sulfuricella sp.]
MKKLLVILSLVVTGLSGCYVAPYRDHDGGYQRDRDHGDQQRDAMTMMIAVGTMAVEMDIIE